MQHWSLSKFSSLCLLTLWEEGLVYWESDDTGWGNTDRPNVRPSESFEINGKCSWSQGYFAKSLRNGSSDGEL